MLTCLFFFSFFFFYKNMQHIALVSQSCHNKVSQTGWLMTIEIYSFTLQEARSPKPRWWQGWFLLQGSEGLSVPCLSVSFLWLQAITSVPWLVKALRHSLPPSLHGLMPCVFVSKFSSPCKDTSLWISIHINPT